MSLVILCMAAYMFMLLTTMIFRKFWNNGLSVKVSFAEKQIEEGQTVVLQEQVENRKILPLLTLTIKFKLDRNFAYVNTENTSRTDNQYRNDCIPVMPYQRVTRSLEMIGTKRGFYCVKEVNFTAADFLFQKIFLDQVNVNTWLYVYPAHSRFVHIMELFHQMYGDYLTNRLQQEDPFAFKGIRDYSPTDPMQKINWKSTARTGSLKVNQFYNTTSQQITIFLNVEQKGILQYEDLIEESIRITRNFLEEFIHKGVPVTIISNGLDRLTRQEINIREGNGMAHVDACLKQLARIDIGSQVRPMENLLREQKKEKQRTADRMSLLISAEQSPELEWAYQEYAGQKGIANWLIPIHETMERYITETTIEGNLWGNGENRIHTEYLVMERMV